MNLQFAIALVKLIVSVVTWFEQQTWYQEGKAAADAEANAEQAKRIADAATARAAPDPYADGSVHDPDRRD